MSRIIYLDNAATTWPKPESVIRRMGDTMRKYGGNPGRGSHRLSLAAADIVYECREELGVMFGASPENIVFTMNATQALNMAIKGLAHEDCHILIDNLCHNAVRRPVISLCKEKHCTYDFYDATLDHDELIECIEEKINPNTEIIVATHQSNISSNVLPLKKIGELCLRKNIRFIVDASQSAGHFLIDINKMNITALCLPGHKGLYGPMGVGALISGNGVHFKTILEGGAGINSIEDEMPMDLPDRLEAGTVALPAIAGLTEGIRFVKSADMGEIHRHEYNLSALLTEGLYEIPGIVTYGECFGSNISFNLKGYSPAYVGEYLSASGICTRTGYHCAPTAHKTLGSFENGSVRVSFSYMNRVSDVMRFMDVLRKIR